MTTDKNAAGGKPTNGSASTADAPPPAAPTPRTDAIQRRVRVRVGEKANHIQLVVLLPHLALKNAATKPKQQKNCLCKYTSLVDKYHFQYL